METERLHFHTATREEMEKFIASQQNDILRAAYTEMLDGCIKHPNQWEWYAIWMIELKDGTHIGELCFKGLNSDSSTEIGYGINEEYQKNGYATEAVSAVTEWALQQKNVKSVLAESESGNTASIRVLEKCGFVPTGKSGDEGSIFVRDNNCRKKGSG